MTPCLLATSPLDAEPEKRRFKMLLHADCEGWMQFVQELSECKSHCGEGATFIVA